MKKIKRYKAGWIKDENEEIRRWWDSDETMIMKWTWNEKIYLRPLLLPSSWEPLHHHHRQNQRAPPPSVHALPGGLQLDSAMQDYDSLIDCYKMRYRISRKGIAMFREKHTFLGASSSGYRIVRICMKCHNRTIKREGRNETDTLNEGRVTPFHVKIVVRMKTYEIVEWNQDVWDEERYRLTWSDMMFEIIGERENFGS